MEFKPTIEHTTAQCSWPFRHSGLLSYSGSYLPECAQLTSMFGSHSYLPECTQLMSMSGSHSYSPECTQLMSMSGSHSYLPECTQLMSMSGSHSYSPECTQLMSMSGSHSYFIVTYFWGIPGILSNKKIFAKRCLAFPGPICVQGCDWPLGIQARLWPELNDHIWA